MSRPRSLKQALRQGLAATLALLLGACQQAEAPSSASEASAPEPVAVVVAPEPVIEAPVAVTVPSPRRPTAPTPTPARPVVTSGASAGGVVIGGRATPPSGIGANAAIGNSASGSIGKTSVPRDAAPQPAPVTVVDSPAAATAPDRVGADAEARQEAQDRLASLQETQAADAQADMQAASGDASPIPQFPWPPPRASASALIPAAFVKPDDVDTATLGDVAAEISAALDTGGYFERSYFGAPGGFAMVTRLERINPDGTPTAEAERWTVGALPLTSFSLADYLRALFTAPSGRYRIIVFVVSSQPFAQSETLVEQGEALAWLSEGLNRLPDNMALAPFTPQHTVTALIYEFEQPGNQEAMLMLPANLMGRVHLQRAQLWDALRQ